MEFITKAYTRDGKEFWLFNKTSELDKALKEYNRWFYQQG